eukprot:763173-Hanusia_phi.AAC.1
MSSSFFSSFPILSVTVCPAKETVIDIEGSLLALPNPGVRKRSRLGEALIAQPRLLLCMASIGGVLNALTLEIIIPRTRFLDNPDEGLLDFQVRISDHAFPAAQTQLACPARHSVINLQTNSSPSLDSL